ncbi:MAG: glycoside hydrolase domain-containing protein [Victivallaceae bacterium]
MLKKVIFFLWFTGITYLGQAGNLFDDGFETPVAGKWGIDKTPEVGKYEIISSGRNSGSALSIITSGRQRMQLFRLHAEKIPGGSMLKLRLYIKGSGVIQFGFLAYNKANKWLDKKLSPPQSLNFADWQYFEFNTIVPDNAYGNDGKIDMIRPCVDVFGDSNILIDDFSGKAINHVVMQSAGIKLPRPFERITPGNGDFKVRYINSRGLFIIEECDTPYIENAVSIKSVEFEITNGSNGEVIASAMFNFSGGVIQAAEIYVPKSFSGNVKIRAKYLDNNSKIIYSGQGYSSFDRFMDMTSGRYMVGGMIRNEHLTNWIKEVIIGQSLFVVSKDSPPNPLRAQKIILPGFAAPTCAQQTVSVVGRQYQFSNLALPVQMQVTQQEPTVGNATEPILYGQGASIILDGTPLTATESLAISSDADTVKLTSGGTRGNLTVNISSTVEQDGIITLLLTLSPQTSANLTSLQLNIPLIAAQATLYHDITDVVYRRLDRTKTGLDAGIGGQAGYTPTSVKYNDVVWYSLASERGSNFSGSFQPMIWLGNEDRGFCWFADSDRNWQVDPDKSAIEIARQSGQVILRINIFNRSVAAVLNQPVTFKMGIMATPVKPPMPHWRGTVFPRWSTLDWTFYNQLTNLRKIVMVGAGDPQFNAGMASPAAKDINVTQDKYAALHDARGSTFCEYWASDYLTLDIAEWGSLFGEWINPNSGGWFSSQYPGHSVEACCWLPVNRTVNSLQDYKLKELDFKLKNVGQISYYEDNSCQHTFDCKLWDQGYTRSDEQRQPEFDLFSYREYLKTAAKVFNDNGMENFLGVHSSAANVIPAFTYASFCIDGEQPARYDYTTDKDYIDRWNDTEYMRALVMGRQYGINTVFLGEMTFPGDDNDGHHTRAWMAIVLPHDISLWDGNVKNRTAVKAWHKIINDLNFYDNPPYLYYYWATGANKVFVNNDADIRVTVWKQLGQSLVMLSNFGDAKTTQTSLDLVKLGLTGSITAIDAETNSTVAINNGAFSVDVPRHDFRMVLIKAQ